MIDDCHGKRALEKLFRREVDLLPTLSKKPWALIEAKLFDTSPARSMSCLAERLKAPQNGSGDLSLEQHHLLGQRSLARREAIEIDPRAGGRATAVSPVP
jgi:hypothetical protein